MTVNEVAKTLSQGLRSAQRSNRRERTARHLAKSLAGSPVAPSASFAPGDKVVATTWVCQDSSACTCEFYTSQLSIAPAAPAPKPAYELWSCGVLLARSRDRAYLDRLAYTHGCLACFTILSLDQESA